MINSFILRAKWTRAKRKGKLPETKPVLVKKAYDTSVSAHQYLLAQLHLAQVWVKQQVEELTWFLASMRGELPPRLDPAKTFKTYYVFLPEKQYFRALEALTTRLGVKLP